MKCVDLKLNPVKTPPDWKTFENETFICAGCMTVLPAGSDELFLIPELDYFFHRHPDRILFRALRLTPEGNVRIAASDSEDENVIQSLSIYLDGLGNSTPRFKSVTDLRKAAATFFNAMRAQNRKIQRSSFHIGADGTFHFG
jgi:hypothetical protein